MSTMQQLRCLDPLEYQPIAIRVWYTSTMENRTVANIVSPADRKPALNAHLMEAMRITTTNLIEEILDIDYALLGYKRELARAQPPTEGGLTLNFSPTQKIRDGWDIEPQIVKFFKTFEGGWTVREVRYEPGKLHLARAFGRGGVPYEQDGIVAGLLKSIDKLLQMRAELVALTRPLRQQAYGLIAKSQKERRTASEKIDRLSKKIVLDWSDPAQTALEAARERQASRETRRLNKITRQTPPE